MHSGRIEVFAGPMFAGKSDELLRRLRKLFYAKTSYLLFKPQKDSRYSKTEVVTHEGHRCECHVVNCASEIIQVWQDHPAPVVAIDEAQFFSREDRPNLVLIVNKLANAGVAVLIAGLDMDAKGQPFGLMPELLASADRVHKLKAYCSVCGKEATMTAHRSLQEDQIELGGNNKYEARCREHWMKPVQQSSRFEAPSQQSPQ